MIDALVDVLRAGRHHRRRRQRACSPTRSAARRRCARPASTSSAPASRAAKRARCYGPSIMPGGSDESWVTLGPILRVDRRDRRGRAVRHARRPRRRRPLREDGAQRHRVRRHAAHRRGLRPDPPRHRQDAPPRSPTCSPSGTRASSSRYLIEITAEVLRQVGRRHRQAARRRHPRPGRRRRAPAPGPCRPRSTSACPSRASPRPCSPASLVEPPRAARRLGDLPGPSRRSTVAAATPTRSSRTCASALYASKIVAYSQGFDEIRAGADAVRLGRSTSARSSKIWRGGCIIRAQFLNRIADAYAETPDLPVLLDRTVLRRGPRPRPGQLAPDRRDRRGRRHPGARVLVVARRTTTASAPSACPPPSIQGQRDFFGAHTYKRIDKPGTFHTLWSGDRTEIETTPSSH